MQPQREPKEREPRLARRSPFAPSVKLCPKCLSPLKSMDGLGGWLVPMDYYCTNCGYSGKLFIEKDSEPAAGNE